MWIIPKEHTNYVLWEALEENGIIQLIKYRSGSFPGTSLLFGVLGKVFNPPTYKYDFKMCGLGSRGLPYSSPFATTQPGFVVNRRRSLSIRGFGCYDMLV
jgi:hypothetical protein